jgi:two-component system chemotaxis response regulator CheB
MTVRMINVLVVEDSPVTRQLLVQLLESDPRIRVTGAVGDGQAALHFIGKSKPDVVVMDIHLPRMDGFEATRRIMETHPLPIVICSAPINTRDSAIVFRAMEAGAIASIEKPPAADESGYAAAAAHLVETVKVMSEVKVVRRTARASNGSAGRFAATAPGQSTAAGTRLRMIGIGASTGGPPVLQGILGALPKDFPVPILIVQHIADGFLAGMADWLNQTTPLQVQIGSHGIRPLAGHVYLAPDDFHMCLASNGAIVLNREPPVNHLRPCVATLFGSMAETLGSAAVGVLLTGMGKDGAAELKLMRDRGAVTIAQDQKSSAVHGMPGAAIALGGATHVLNADAIAAVLISLANR